MNKTIDSITKNEWDRLINSILRPYVSMCRFDPLLDVDDFYQEAWVSLMIAAEKYDPSRNVKFTTFASYYIRGRLLRYITKHLNNKPDITTDQPELLTEAEGENVDKAIESEDFIKTILNKSDNPELLKKYFIDGKTLREIAQTEGVSAQMINNRIRKMIGALYVRLNHENA